MCHLSDTFPIQNCLKQDIILQLLFHFVVKYAIKEAQANKGGLKLKGLPHFLIYADDVNLLSENIHRGDGHTFEQGAFMNKLNILPSVRTCCYSCTSRAVPLLSS
jgi:hypothetical protein